MTEPTPRQNDLEPTERSRFASGCAVVVFSLYAASTVACCSGDVAGSAVTRLCVSEETLDVLDVFHRDEEGHYPVMQYLLRGDCVSVHGNGIVAQGWDSGAPMARVRLDDGRWGHLALRDRPAHFSYAPHLAFTRAPIQTTHYLSCVAYIVWVFARLVRTLSPSRGSRGER